MYARLFKSHTDAPTQTPEGVQPPVQPFQAVFKFNPYHDEQGRFTDHDRHTFMSTGPKFAKTVAKLKQKLAAAEKVSAAKVYKESAQDISGSQKQAEKWLDATESEYKAMSSAERAMVKKYTASSGALNQSSGKLGSGLTTTEKIGFEMVEKMKTLDSALSKMHAPEDMVLFRAGSVHRAGGPFSKIRDDSTPEELEALIGKSFTEHAYASSSSRITKAEAFMHGDTRVMMQIEMPKGHPGAWVGGSHERGVYDTEQEFLIPRGTKYVVTGVTSREFVTDMGHKKTRNIIKVRPLMDGETPAALESPKQPAKPKALSMGDITPSIPHTTKVTQQNAKAALAAQGITMEHHATDTHMAQYKLTDKNGASVVIAASDLVKLVQQKPPKAKAPAKAKVVSSVDKIKPVFAHDEFLSEKDLTKAFADQGITLSGHEDDYSYTLTDSTGKTKVVSPFALPGLLKKKPPKS